MLWAKSFPYYHETLARAFQRDERPVPSDAKLPLDAARICQIRPAQLLIPSSAQKQIPKTKPAMLETFSRLLNSSAEWFATMEGSSDH